MPDESVTAGQKDATVTTKRPADTPVTGMSSDSSALTSKPPQLSDESPEDKVNRLRRELAEAEQALPPREDHTNVKVGEPHTGFAFGNADVGTDFTPVHNTQLPSLQRAANEAGVTLIVEGE